ncbi:hypothetical protein EKS39_06030, partial [Enterobacter roggenkampii]
SLWHLYCSEVSISPLFRWPNSVNHFRPNPFPESSSQNSNLPPPKPLCLYSALYNEHQKLRRTAKEVSKNI